MLNLQSANVSGAIGVIDAAYRSVEGNVDAFRLQLDIALRKALLVLLSDKNSDAQVTQLIELTFQCAERGMYLTHGDFFNFCCNGGM